MQRSALLLAAALASMSLPAPAALAQAGPFLDKEGPDLWRVSKLVGVDVLGPDGKRIGDVTDVLLDHDGHSAVVVIGVGGFLGLGQKDVALPSAQVRFTDAPRPGAPAVPAAPPSAALGGPVGTTAGVPGGQPTGLVPTPVAPPGGTASPARPAPRPDHATVDLTADQLKSAPAFTFAR